MKAILKAIIGFAVMAAVTVFTAFAVSAADGYEIPLSAISDNVTAGMIVDDCRENRWTAVSGSSYLSSVDGRDAVCVVSDTNEQHAYRSLGSGVNFSKYGSLSLNVYAESSESSVLVTFSGFGDSYTAEIEPGEWHRVYISLKNSGWSDSISMNSSGASAVYIGEIHTTLENQAVNAGLMCAERVRAITGDMDFNGYFNVIPDDDGNADIRASGVLFPGADSTVVRVMTDGRAGGTLTFSVQSPDMGMGYVDCGTVNLNEEIGSYLFYVKNAVNIKNYSLKYSGMGNSEFHISEVRFFAWSDGGSSRTGTLSVRRISGGQGDQIDVDGTLDSVSCVKYIDDDIALYDVPYWMSEEERFTMPPIGTVSVSKKFDFSESSDSLLYNPELCRYVAAVISGEDIIPITPAVSIAGASVQQSLPAFGICTENGEGILESAASFTSIDIDVDSFVSSGGSGKLHSYGGRYYNMNGDRLKTLDRAVRTARISCKNYFIRMNFNGGDALIEDNVRRICAVTDFICSRYPDIAGIILGINSDVPEADTADPMEYEIYVRNTAAVYQFIYSTASKYINPIRMIVPVGENALGDAAKITDSSLFCSMLSLAIKNSGTVQYTVMYEYSGESDAVLPVRDFMSSYIYGASIGYSAAADMILMWDLPPEKTDVSSVISVCENIMSLSGRGLKLSLLLSPSEGIISENFYDKLFMMKRADTFSSNTYNAEIFDTPSKNTFDLWNFTSSYSSKGWIATGLCMEVKTQINSYLSDLNKSQIRVLKASISSSDGALGTTGSAAGRFDTSVSMTGVKAIELYLIVTGHKDTVPVYITFGSDNTVFRYKAEVPSGMPSYVLCSIPENMLQKMDYTCVTVTDETPSEVDIVKISAVTDGTVNGVQGSSNEFDSQSGDSSNQVYYISMAIVITTMLMFSTVMKRDKRSERKNFSAGRK